MRILSRRYSSSRSPYARRWMTRTLLFTHFGQAKVAILSMLRPRNGRLAIFGTQRKAGRAFSALSGFVWVEIESSAVEVDRGLEVLTVPRATRLSA